MPSNYQQIADDNSTVRLDRLTPLLKITYGIYSERTHFVYELLQNAEDAIWRRAKAATDKSVSKKVTFHLFKDRLEFRHFGKLFDERDVKGVCGLAEGTAADDPSRLGRFGIGFKSVYTYTSTPEIHSGDEHFCIEDYVRPKPIETVGLSDGETLFVFPFDKPTEAFEEIGERLRELGTQTLLFLRFIEEITWIIEEVSEGAYRRDSNHREACRLVSLNSVSGGKEQQEDWLMFDRPLGIQENPNAKVEVAFQVRRGESQSPLSIVPCRHSLLAVFFPTKIETKLKFLIQGPYDTTPTRETIYEDSKWNRELIDRTASLVVDSLPAIRDMVLLTTSFLETLPLNADDFPEGGLFRPIFEKVRSALKEEAFLPTDDGKFVSARHAKLPSSTSLRELLSEEQLTALYAAQEPLKWLPAEKRTPELSVYLSKELRVGEVTPEAFARRFSVEFIQQQSDEWVVRFYTFLSDQLPLWRKADRFHSIGPLRNKPFIRVEGNRHVPPFGAGNVPNVFLPPEGETEFSVVKREVSADEQAQAFLANQLGLTKPDVVAEVFENVLPRYGQANDLSSEQHARDLEKIFAAMRTVPEQNKASLESKLRETRFLKALRLGSAQSEYMSAPEIYLRTPELELYFSGCNEDVWFLDESCAEADLNLLKTLGAEDAPRRKDFRPSFNNQELADFRDGGGCTEELELRSYELHGLGNCLSRISVLEAREASKLALVIWGIVAGKATPSPYRSTPDFFQGIYSWRFRRRTPTKRFPARFLERLRDAPWLPGKDGRMHKPSELTLDELPDEFLRNEVLADILKMLPRTIDALAKEMHIDPQVLNFLRNNENAQSHIKRLMASERARETASRQEPPDVSILEDSGVDEDSERQLVGDTKKETSSDRQRVRLETRVYVKAGETSVSTHEASDETERRTATDEAGIERVLRYERGEGRLPRSLPHHNPGYDIESTDSSGNKRYIEVKSLAGAWDKLGVALTVSQFTKAQELNEQFWLYVVERAEQDDFDIHRIQNPTHLVKQYFYDHGWKALARQNYEPRKTLEAAEEI